VINHLVKRVAGLSSSFVAGDKIFLCRRPSRISEETDKYVQDYLQSRGFELVWPEHLPVDQQIAIMAKASVVISFPGSQLHNTLFLPEKAKVVELGDERSKHKPHHNQEYICAVRSQDLIHVPWSSNKFDYEDRLASILASYP